VVWTLPLVFDREGGVRGVSMFLLSSYLLLASVLERERQRVSLEREREMRRAEKSRSYMGGEIHDAVYII